MVEHHHHLAKGLSQQQQYLNAQKRKATTAGLTNSHGRPIKAIKRRASKACQCCRARKVRCNVVEHGAPCTNCRLDEIECVVSESKRKKKFPKPHASNSTAEPPSGAEHSSQQPRRPGDVQHPLDGLSLSTSDGLISSAAVTAAPLHDAQHVPHSIYQSNWNDPSFLYYEAHRKLSHSTVGEGLADLTESSPLLLNHAAITAANNGTSAQFLNFLADNTPRSSKVTLPYYVKPLPSRIGPDELAYLEKKGALSVPDDALRNRLLAAYISYVHPTMPLLDIHEFLEVIQSGDGRSGRISLFLFNAVMFAGTAYVATEYLLQAGFSSRKEARKHFFVRTRLLYDFDYEFDRIALVQGLLLMTFWYETPDDQKDTWHYMGLATSLAHTIGLHRNPERSTMDDKRQKLWKRLWWSLYVRDRLIAVGMRRPTRIKGEDCDVPPLAIEDFDLSPIPDHITCIPRDCIIARDAEKQRELAELCVEQAKLCLCISHILATQYSVCNNPAAPSSHDEETKTTTTTMMLLPRKSDAQQSEIHACDEELQEWRDALPTHLSSTAIQANDVTTATRPLIVHRAMLHLVYQCALSALHRPQVLPSGLNHRQSNSNATQQSTTSDTSSTLTERSRRIVRAAATEITSIATTLHELNLVRYLPTTGVTVLLPAIIIHLLDIKSPNEATRRASLRGFCACMTVMSKLRENYAAADFSTAFLEAAIRKAEIVVPKTVHGVEGKRIIINGAASSDIEVPAAEFQEMGRFRAALNHPAVAADASRARGRDQGPYQKYLMRALTPPEDESLTSSLFTHPYATSGAGNALARTYLASTPPSSSGSHIDPECDGSFGADMNGDAGFEGDMDLFLTFGEDQSPNMADAALGTDLSMIDPDLDFEALINMDIVGEATTTADENQRHESERLRMEGQAEGILA